jgi:hypothetical protein
MPVLESDEVRLKRYERLAEYAKHTFEFHISGPFFFGLLSALGYAIIYHDVEHAGRTEAHAAVAATVPANLGTAVSPVHRR